MQSTRRWFLKLPFVTGFAAGVNALFAPAIQAGLAGSGDYATFTALLDTLIPEDETPSATQLGVTEALYTKLSGNRSFSRLLHGGCAWLDEQARWRGAAAFPALDDAGRDEILALAAAGETRSLPRDFFDRIRRLAFSEYYADPRGWRDLDYPGPPQRRGFTDYTRPPRALHEHSGS